MGKAIVDVKVKKALTDHQLKIFKDLKKAIRENIIINKDHIIDLYVNCKFPLKKEFQIEIKRYHPIEHMHKMVVTREQYIMLAEVKNAALKWYKGNLGSVIVKGKIFVLPPIES